MSLQARNESTKWLWFRATCVKEVFGSGVPRNSRRDWNVHFDFLHMLLCWSIHISLFCFALLFLFHYETTVWLDYHSLTQTITEMTQFKTPRGTYDPFWLINTELTTLPEAHARCKGVIHLLSFVFTLAPEIRIIYLVRIISLQYCKKRKV